MENDLQQTAKYCLEEFQSLVQQLNSSQLETLQFVAVQTAWNNYYFGHFAKFDALLRHYVERGGTKYTQILPLSISHHNLHRLMEVLELELHDQPLGKSRIPERLQDLLEASNRTIELMQAIVN